ncbi:ABC transporter ATP-binding protein [Gluconobacter sp. GP1]|uniref:ABC transporter ATP-binding protein n=1 Tax=Gluconobacter sp. GP1 TaxID=3046423 RepID=UPI00293E7942|nr:ABC transporter ATP-binding protein [Gluconobacter sp. GP1]
MSELHISNLSITTTTGDLLVHVENAVFHEGVTALIGHNGAGKSTFLQYLSGLRSVPKGCVRLDGRDLASDRSSYLERIVYQPQNFSAYPELSGVEFLIFFAVLRGYRRRDAKMLARYWLERVGLPVTRQPTAQYSQGMLQKLGFAYALQSGAPLCILDEPFAGVDPDARKALLEIAATTRDRIFLICTHHVDEMRECNAGFVTIANGQLNVEFPA